MIYFVTGTDTGVGKTVLAALLVWHLRAEGIRALAVKPFCSGGREDARLLRQAQGNQPTLDEINPWHFRAPVTPLLAARIEKREINRSSVLRFLRKSASNCEALVVEGAGGLLSPLGEGFDSRDLILELRAEPIVVCPNRLGALNQVRMALSALPRSAANRTRIALMKSFNVDQAARANFELLAEYHSADRIMVVPRIKWPAMLDAPCFPRRIRHLFREWGFRIDT